MAIVLSGSTGIDAGSLPVANTGKISAGAGLPVILNTAGVDRVIVDTAGNILLGINQTLGGTTSKIQTVGNITTADAGYNGSNLFIGATLTNDSSNNGATPGVEFRRWSGSSSTHGVAKIGVDLSGNLIFKNDSKTTNTEATTTRMTLDASGSLLLTSGTGGLGYGTGAGGQVTQLTSKSTAVTLNKPSGQIIMNNAALAANTIVQFSVINSLITVNDEVQTWVSGGTDNAQQYRVWANPSNGSFFINVKNESGGSLSHAIVLNFQIRKGANA